MNPLLIRHLYSSARRNRFFWLLTLYLLGIGLLMVFFLLVTSLPTLFGENENATLSMLDLFAQGRAIYWFSSVMLLLTANILTPLNALGALAGERENRTLDLLITTTLRPRDIVLGKISAALLTGAIYILAPLPLLMTGFWLGGVSTIELLLTFLLLILTMVLSISWAMYISSLVRKTIAAVLLFYGINLGLLPILAVVVTLMVGFYESSRYLPTLPILPFWIEAIIQYGWVILTGLHPMSAAIATEALGLDQGTWFLLKFPVERFDPAKGSTVFLGTATLPSPWIIYTFSAVLTITLLLWMTTRRLGKPERA